MMGSACAVGSLQQRRNQAGIARRRLDHLVKTSGGSRRGGDTRVAGQHRQVEQPSPAIGSRHQRHQM